MRQFTDPIYAGLLEAAPDAMVCVDSGGLIVLVNAQAERLFGYPRQELVGQPVEMLIPDAVKGRHPDLRAGYAADPQPRQMGAALELSARRRDGTTFPAEIALSALDTDQGLLVSAAIRDITQQQQAALAQWRLASIIQSSHDAVIGKTLDQVVTSWNPAAERLYGYAASEMIGQHVQILFPEAERERENRMLIAVVRGERVDELKTQRIRKDGSVVTVSLTLSPITDALGEIIGIATVTRDLTERQRAEARFTGLLEAAPDAMVCVNSGGLIVLVNAQAERLFGYPRGELVGQPVEMLVPDAVEARHPDLRAGYAADPQPRQMGAGLELSARRRDGTTFPAEIALSALDTDQGLLVSAAIRDITQQQQAALAQSRLASIVESSHDAVIGQTLDRVITTWNPAAERLYGYCEAEMIGASAYKLTPGEHLVAERENGQAIVRGEQLEPYQTQQLRKDGTRVAVSVTLSPITDRQARIIGMSGVSRDISAQEQAEARFRGLLEAAPDATVCVDQSGLIVLVNAQAERLFGYPREALTGQPVEILVPDAVKGRHPDLRAGYAAAPRPRQMGAGLELSARRRDSTAFPAEIALSALDTDQGLLISASIRDITKQKQARDDLRRTNQNLQSFSYSLAHDLRTPLRSLAGFSTALIEDYADKLGQDGRGYLQRIEDASKHMGQILDDLLHLSSVYRTEVTLAQVDLGAEAASIAAEIQHQDPGRSVRFTIQQPAQALADRALIREVLRQLLDNAWKFTTGREDASIEFGLDPIADGRVCAYVRDNGAGFDSAYVHKLFTPFQRLHTTQEFPGTGVGLASVRQIVDRHGGRTWADGAPGQGATFFFTLPAAEPGGQLD
jgi:PAS domain S-box-containing protein